MCFVVGRYEGRREKEIRGRIRSDEEEAQGSQTCKLRNGFETALFSFSKTCVRLYMQLIICDSQFAIRMRFVNNVNG